MLNDFKFVAIFLGFCYYIINEEQRKKRRNLSLDLAHLK
jgi:hypothetical protein